MNSPVGSLISGVFIGRGGGGRMKGIALPQTIWQEQECRKEHYGEIDHRKKGFQICFGNKMDKTILKKLISIKWSSGL